MVLERVQLKQLFILYVGICIAYILVRLGNEAIFDVGSSWQQGDWLVNSHEAWVRRGLFGSFILTISDLIPLNPAQTVMLLQGLLLLIVAAVLLLIMVSLQGTNALWLLILCPAFIPIFWAADFGGGLRKELLAYAAFSLLILSVFRPAEAFAWRCIAALLFIAAVLGHEINILLLPAFLAVLMLTKPKAATAPSGGAFGMSSSPADIALAAAVGVVALFSAVFTFLYPNVEDIRFICDPLVERGMHQGICHGAIATFSDSIETIWGYGFERTALEAVQFLFTYAAVAVLFGIVAHYSSNRKLLWVVFCATGVPLVLLYPISNDWGRWLNMHLTSAFFVVVALMLARKVSIRPVPVFLLVLVAASSLFWSPAHTFGLRPWGLIGQVNKILGTV